MSNDPHPATLEHPPQGEAQAIQAIVKAFKLRYGKANYPGSGLARRAVHAKAHGLLQGEFIVEAGLPEQFRQGIFQKPGSYPVWLRYSNGATTPHADIIPDVRAVALKIMSVPGEKILEAERNATTQDFILANHPGFFVRNAIDFAKLLSNPLTFFVGLNPFHWRLKELGNLAGSFLNSVATPLGIRYWSQTPYLLGSRAVKYSIQPSTPNPRKKRWFAGANYLRTAMADELSRHEVSLDFLVQLQGNPLAMPVEDPTVIWDERVSPFRKVATIRIPRQGFDNAERDALAENFSFTPWHSLPEHRPLGGINRARRPTYEALSEYRHQLNGIVREEP